MTDNKLCKIITLKFQVTYVVYICLNHRIEVILTNIQNICFGYLFELPYRDASNKYLKHLFYEEIKQNLSNIQLCPLRILHNNKFILVETSFGSNAVIVTRVHCKTASQYQNCCLRTHKSETIAGWGGSG